MGWRPGRRSCKRRFSGDGLRVYPPDDPRQERLEEWSPPRLGGRSFIGDTRFQHGFDSEFGRFQVRHKVLRRHTIQEAQ